MDEEFLNLPIFELKFWFSKLKKIPKMGGSRNFERPNVERQILRNKKNCQY